MTVVTISRQLGSHGDTVAQLLCERLGYRYFDKNLMLGLAVQAGVAPYEVVDLSDEKHRARSLIERLFGNYAAPMSDPSTWAVSAEMAAQERMSAAQIRHLILAAHAQGNVVIVGRGGQVVLHDMPGTLHVRVMAPLEVRVRRQQERTGMTAAAARAQLLERDRATADFVRQYFGAGVGDPELYDLIVNTGKLTALDAVDLIVSALGVVDREADAQPPPTVASSAAGPGAER
ncbi:MAG: AAA family ATPase [Nitrososphaerales archaeon]